MARWMAGVLVAGVCVAAGAVPAQAHLRDYLVNEQYYTAKRGEFEVELWNDYNLPEADQDGTHNSKHQIEVEYGVTDHFQLAYYEVYTWDRAQDWARDGLKLEAKYRFAEAGQWPVDVAIYGEYANPNGSRDEHSDTLEGKLILSKDLGPWNLIGNVVFEREINAHEEWQLEVVGGVSYGVTPRVRLGMELKDTLGALGDLGQTETQAAYLVPGVYVALTPHVRILVGPAFGLTEAADNLQVHSIVEVEF